MLCMGPKLEDFLGGGNAAVGRFGVAATESDSGGIYDDSELKTIAAGFLRGLTADGVKGVVAAEAGVGKKGADSFGQRTSIYRGVTRSVII